MDIFGLGKAASTAIIVGAIVTALAGTAWYVIDRIGDAREATLRKEALEDRLKGIRDANVREALLRALPVLAKARCAAEGAGTECCQPGAVRVPRCTAPLTGDQ